MAVPLGATAGSASGFAAAIRILFLPLALALPAAFPTGIAQGQEIGLSGQVELGPDENGVGGAAGIRLEVLEGAVGGYVRVAAAGGSSDCLLSFPATCNYPDGTAWQYVIGVTGRTGLSDRSSLQVSGGFGVASWSGRDEMGELEARFKRRVSGPFSLLVGARYSRILGVERDSPVVRQRDIDFFNFLLGMHIGLSGS